MPESRRPRFPRLLATMLLAGFAPGAGAVSVTYTEHLWDRAAPTPDARDLVRWRTVGGIVLTVEDADARIAAENGVGAAFGLYGDGAVTFSHRLDWFDVARTLSATLTIRAFGAEGGDDVVRIEGFDAALVPDGGPAGATRAQVSIVDSGVLGWLLWDDRLDVVVDRNRFAGALDPSSVYASELLVVARPVPLPHPAPLLGAGLLGLIAFLRRPGARSRGGASP